MATALVRVLGRHPLMRSSLALASGGSGRRRRALQPLARALCLLAILGSVACSGLETDGLEQENKLLRQRVTELEGLVVVTPAARWSDETIQSAELLEQIVEAVDWLHGALAVAQMQSQEEDPSSTDFFYVHEAHQRCELILGETDTSLWQREHRELLEAARRACRLGTFGVGEGESLAAWLLAADWYRHDIGAALENQPDYSPAMLRDALEGRR